MTGIVPAIPFKQKSDAVSRLVDHHPDTAAAKPKRHGWGSVEVLSCSGGHRIERVTVKRGKSLPAHYHQHRSEHWIVVEGVAKITIDETVMMVEAGESVYVPQGAIHRMENTCSLPMILVEVQLGNYLGEDDITRYEDVYART